MAEIENSLGQNLGGGGGIWGTITGDILEQADLINYLDLNFYPLVGNPSNFLTEVQADLLYYPLSSNPANYLIAADLPDLSGYVPYVGATGNLNLGNYSLDVADIAGNYTSVYGAGLFIGGAGGEFSGWDASTGIYIDDGAGGNITLGNGNLSLSYGLSIAGASINYLGLSDLFSLPDKSGLGGTFAMLSDIPTTPDLQSVTVIGADTNIPIFVRDATFPLLTYSGLNDSGLNVVDPSNQAYLSSSNINFLWAGTISASIGITLSGTGRNTEFLLPVKPTGTYTLATTADITGGATNLGYTASAINGIVTSDTGTDATLPLADATNAGLLAPADFTKLGNQSGTNTGDNSTNTNANAYADAKVADAITNGVTTVAPSQNAVFDALDLKANKSTSAYSKKLNKTNATANEVEVPYRSDGFQTYTDTVTATGTLNGSPTASYKWRQDDDCVEFWFNVDYSLAGATITQIQIPMPSDLPNPLVPTGFSGASVVLYVGNGHAALNLINTGASASDMFSSLRRNAANTDFEFTINMTSGNYKTYRMYIKYPIS